MAIQFQLLSLLIFFSLSSSSYSAAASSNIISDAAQVLSNIGMVSMSLTLQYAPKTLIPQTQNLTIFSPSDSIFADSNQPSLSLLRFHFSPQSLPPSSLNSLPFGSTITTFFPNHRIILTSSPTDDQFSLNGVKIGKKPVYDGGSLVVYKIERFFDPNFKVSDHGSCGEKEYALRDTNSFGKASKALRSSSTGYIAMASFLDSQLERPKENRTLTIFAPSDEMVKLFVGNWSAIPSIFLRLIVPCRIAWRDLVNWDMNTVLQSYSEGFNISVAKSGTGDVMINGVKVVAMDMFQSDSLVVHGLSGGDGRVERGNGAAENFKTNFNVILLAIFVIFFL